MKQLVVKVPRKNIAHDAALAALRREVAELNFPSVEAFEQYARAQPISLEDFSIDARYGLLLRGSAGMQNIDAALSVGWWRVLPLLSPRLRACLHLAQGWETPGFVKLHFDERGDTHARVTLEHLEELAGAAHRVFGSVPLAITSGHGYQRVVLGQSLSQTSYGVPFRTPVTGVDAALVRTSPLQQGLLASGMPYPFVGRREPWCGEGVPAQRTPLIIQRLLQRDLHQFFSPPLAPRPAREEPSRVAPPLLMERWETFFKRIPGEWRPRLLPAYMYAEPGYAALMYNARGSTEAGEVQKRLPELHSLLFSFFGAIRFELMTPGGLHAADLVRADILPRPSPTEPPTPPADPRWEQLYRSATMQMRAFLRQGQVELMPSRVVVTFTERTAFHGKQVLLRFEDLAVLVSRTFGTTTLEVVTPEQQRTQEVEQAADFKPLDPPESAPEVRRVVNTPSLTDLPASGNWAALTREAPMLVRAFLKPAYLHAEPGYVSVTYDEQSTFHADQMAKKFDVLIPLVARVFGAVTLELVAPNGGRKVVIGEEGVGTVEETPGRTSRKVPQRVEVQKPEQQRKQRTHKKKEILYIGALSNFLNSASPSSLIGSDPSLDEHPCQSLTAGCIEEGTLVPDGRRHLFSVGSLMIWSDKKKPRAGDYEVFHLPDGRYGIRIHRAAPLQVYVTTNPDEPVEWTSTVEKGMALGTLVQIRTRLG